MPASPINSYTVTLTTHDVVYNVLTLIRAIEDAAPKLVGMVQFQNDPDNAACKVSIGDSTLSTTNRGYKLQTGDSDGFNDPHNGIDLSGINLISTVDAVKVNIFLMEFLS